jgi:methyl-accepting chemotaxis protein
MKRKNLLSHSLSIWLSWVLGVIAIIAGAVIIIVSFTAWEPVRSSLVSISEGLHSANSAIELIGKDFGTSSSLVSEVSNSIRSTKKIVHETWITVNSIRETVAEIRGLVLTVGESLENLPVAITSMVGRNYFLEAVSSLNNTFYASGELITQMEHLSATMEPLEPVLEEVASGVDSLAGDLFTTEEAFNEATQHLEKAAGAIENAADSTILPMIVAGTGFIPLFAGFYLIIQGVALRRLYSTGFADVEETE